jgi:hypothetical protein
LRFRSAPPAQCYYKSNKILVKYGRFNPGQGRLNPKFPGNAVAGCTRGFGSVAIFAGLPRGESN